MIKVKIDDTEYTCNYKKDVVYTVINYYREKSDTCVGELLKTVKIYNMSVQDVVDVFAKIMKIIEDDRIIQIQEDTDIICRWLW